MNKDERNALLYALISIDDMYERGNIFKARRHLLRVIMRLIMAVYSISKKQKESETCDSIDKSSH